MIQTRIRFLCVFLFFSLAIAGLTGCTGCGPGISPRAEGLFATDLPGTDTRPTLFFTNVIVNKPSRATFRLYNKGLDQLTIEEWTFTKDTDKQFRLLAPPTLPLTLEPGKDKGITLTVEMTAKSAGIHEALLRIASSDAKNTENDGYYSIHLRNQALVADPRFACESAIKSAANTLHFGSVKRGDKKRLRCTLTNTGSAPLVVEGFRYTNQKGANKPYTDQTPEAQRRSDFQWQSPAKFPVTLHPQSKDALEIWIVYSPSDAVPKEDQGVFAIRTPDDKSINSVRNQIKVVGLTLAPAIQLIPLNAVCTQDDDCSDLDSRLTCRPLRAGASDKHCITKPGIPTLLKFPLTPQGQRIQRRFVVRSTGDTPLTITAMTLGKTPGDFQAPTLSGPLTLAPGQEKEFTVTYAPTTDKPGKDTLTVDSNAGATPKAPLQLEGAAFGCDLRVTPKKIKFLGPRTRRVTLFNQGNRNCRVKTVALKEGKAFLLIPTQIRDQVIAPNGRFDFLVRFSPRDRKAHQDAIVVTLHDPGSAPIEIPLESTIGVEKECELSATPSNLNFRFVAAGTSKKLRVEATNKGWGSCKISSLNLINITPGGGVTAFKLESKVNTPLRLESGNTLRLSVLFTPPSDAGYTGKIAIASNDLLQPNLQIQLSGSAGTACLEVVPQQMDFGSVKFGCATPTRKLEVYHTGAAKCPNAIAIGKIQCTPGRCFPIDPKAEFRINSAPALPATLGPGQNIAIGMSYKAKDLGVDTGTLEIHNSIPGQSPRVVPMIGEGVSTDEQKDVFRQLSRPMLDVLFIVDDSCSMSEEQDSVAKNARTFMNWALRLKVDYHIGVATTDVTGSSYPAGCLRGTTKIIKPSTPKPVDTLASNVRLGTRGSATEKGLEAAYQALSPARLVDPNCNRGFLRKDAALSLIFISDEDDFSTRPTNFYVSFFRNLKGYRNPHLLNASAIVGPPPASCRNPGTGSATPGKRYWEVAKVLTGTQASICDSNWSQKLSILGQRIFGFRRLFFLSRQADPKSIVVKVNGKVVKEDPNDGWSYDPTENTVLFSRNNTPAPGGTIQIVYKAICLP